jgi:NAD(P)-dependent dehydrogenase (short-subunit alcohol dehydrogenase family)
MNKNDVVLITGANSGMGKASSIELAKTGAKIVMLCRDEKRGSLARDEVVKLSGNNAVDLMTCDLGSLSDIRKFCDEFKKKYGRLNVLINNAGVILPGRHVTKDGFEMQFGVNHLGHFLLTNLLLDVMTNVSAPLGTSTSVPVRIVVVSSGAHRIGKIHFDDVNLTKNYTVWRSYAQSKLANILFTYELARRLKGQPITVNALHPGAVATDMGVNRETGFGKFLTRLLKPFFLSPLEGAGTAIYLATSEEVSGVTGKYFYKKKPVASSPRSYDEDDAVKLWDLSAKLTGLKSV